MAIQDIFQEMLMESRKIKPKAEKEKIVEVGRGYDEEEVNVLLSGEDKFSKEVSDIIQKTNFKFKNKANEMVESGLAKIIKKSKFPILTDKKSGDMKQDIALTIIIPVGSIKSALKEINKNLKDVKFNLSIIKD